MMLEFIESYGDPHILGDGFEVNIVFVEQGDIYTLRNLNILLREAIGVYADEEYRQQLIYFDDDDEGWLKLKLLRKKFNFMSKGEAKLFIMKNLVISGQYGYLKIRCEGNKIFWRVDEKCTDIEIYSRKWLYIED